jgi:hypothetical protein
MKSRLALLLVVVCALVLQTGVVPAAAQESPQTVKAAIPPQERPTITAPMPPRASVSGQNPELAPAPKSNPEAANVRLEVTISYQVGNAAPVKRTATLTVADQGSGSLRSGNQVAVPSTTSYAPAPAATKGDGAAPAPPPMPTTSFSYRSVGLNVDARNVYIQGNKARLNLSVEFSAIDEKTADSAGRPPSFPTFSQNLSLILENGKPIVVGQSSDYVDNVERKQSVEVKATILR